jgi:predicted PurR-regulated permease PerM
VPLAGATIAAVIVSSVAFVDSTRNGIIVLVFFLLYQQLENQVIQPVVYRRTVQVSPLIVLVAVLIGAQLAGVVGALVAIPFAGAIQILIRDIVELRGASGEGDAAGPAPSQAATLP